MEGPTTEERLDLLFAEVTAHDLAIRYITRTWSRADRHEMYSWICETLDQIHTVEGATDRLHWNLQATRAAVERLCRDP